MRSAKIVFLLFILIIFSVSAAHSQQQYIQTVTAQNKSCNTACSVIDLPELNNNPLAIILITPVPVNGVNRNPHPIGAYFMYMHKWSVFNLDGVTINEGAKFNVEYYAAPSADQFIFIVPQRVHTKDISYIDRAGLNYNPNARVRVFPTSNPARGALYNKAEVKVEYDPIAFKWFIANLDGTPVPSDSAYNVVVAGAAVIAHVDPKPEPSGTPQLRVPPNATPTPTPITLITTIDPGTVVPGGQSTHNWALLPEPTPSIPANSEIVLFIHGMDSRAEEAGDITNALFAIKANPSGTLGTTGTVGPPSAAQTAVELNRILHKYEGCILEKYETQQDMANRGLNPGLSGLATTAGLQARDSIACAAGNICSRASRQSGFMALQAQANSGNAVNFETNLKKVIPSDCFECSKHAEWHPKHVHCTMDAGGNSGFPAGPAFETCKAGVDIVALVTYLINDIHSALSSVGGGPVTGGPTIATNFSNVQFNSCAIPSEGCPEVCDHPDNFAAGARTAVTPFETVDGRQVPLYFEPQVPLALLDSLPPNLQINVPAGHNIGKNEGRLRLDLRSMAAIADPEATLRIAAYKYAAGDTVAGQAFADLSVTGHRSFATFATAKLGEPFCVAATAARPSEISAANALNGCRTALDRAYRVANFLRTGQRGDTPADKTRKTNERLALGWIAVSGEDDSPHRPVNAPSSDYPQYDINVTVETPMSKAGNSSVTVRTRYVIAQSRTEHPNAPGKNLVVLSLDLPTSGYSENLKYDLVSPLTDIGSPKWTVLPSPLVIPTDMLFAVPGYPQILPPGTLLPPFLPLPDFQASGNTPLLQFIENFIVRFSEALAQKQYLNQNDFKAVMGGSLGGNMTFRLARRPGAPWPKSVVWSPASIWTSLGAGADLLKHYGPRAAYEGANAAVNSPTDGDRAAFFGSWDKPIVPLVIPMAQSDSWMSDFYACKKSSIAAARLDRQETYDPRFLAWHWRLGGEQLLFSHQNLDPATNRPLYTLNTKPMLLGCGIEDHVAFNDICPATQATARQMINTPGKALFLEKTGHSLDNERRFFWARQVFDFLAL